jgi:hypothetical protein
VQNLGRFHQRRELLKTIPFQPDGTDHSFEIHFLLLPVAEPLGVTTVKLGPGDRGQDAWRKVDPWETFSIATKLVADPDVADQRRLPELSRKLFGAEPVGSDVRLAV